MRRNVPIGALVASQPKARGEKLSVSGEQLARRKKCVFFICTWVHTREWSKQTGLVPGYPKSLPGTQYEAPCSTHLDSFEVYPPEPRQLFAGTYAV